MGLFPGIYIIEMTIKNKNLIRPYSTAQSAILICLIPFSGRKQFCFVLFQCGDEIGQ